MSMFLLHTNSFQRDLGHQSAIPKQTDLMKLLLCGTFGPVCHTGCSGLRSVRLPVPGSLWKKKKREMTEGRKWRYQYLSGTIALSPASLVLSPFCFSSLSHSCAVQQAGLQGLMGTGADGEFFLASDSGLSCTSPQESQSSTRTSPLSPDSWRLPFPPDF